MKKKALKILSLFAFVGVLASCSGGGKTTSLSSGSATSVNPSTSVSQITSISSGTTLTTTSSTTSSTQDVLLSISIDDSGFTKNYTLGDEWNRSSLVFIAHYSLSPDRDISNEQSLSVSFNPNTASSTSISEVKVTASYLTKSTEKTITGISVSEPFVPVTSVTLDKHSYTTTVGDDPVQLIATVLPTNATEKTVVWSTNNSTVASVENGLVTALGEGSATITASCGGKSDSCVVSVEDVLQSIRIDGDMTKKAYETGDSWSTDGLEFKGIYSISGEKTITPDLVTFNPSKASSTSITSVKVSISYFDKSAEKTITNISVTDPVISVTGVSLNITSCSVVYGDDPVQLTATVSPSDATNKKVTWSSSDTSVATVNDGLVSFLKKGTAKITVTTEDGGKTDECDFVIEEVCWTAHIYFESLKSWKDVTLTKIGDTSEYKSSPITFNSLDKFCIWNGVFTLGRDIWYHYNEVKSTDKVLVTGDDDGNILFKDTPATYEIYVDTVNAQIGLNCVSYSVSIEDGASQPLSMKLTEGGTIEYALSNCSLSKNQKLVFYKDDVEIDIDLIDIETGSNAIKGETIVVHNDFNAEEGKGVFLKKSNEGYLLWIDGYVEPPAPTYKDYILHGKLNGSTEWVDLDLTQSTEEGKSSEYIIKDIEMKTGDEFIFHYTGDIWYGYSDLQDGCSSMFTKYDESNNMVVIDDGTYDFYVGLDVEGKHIWASKQGSTPTVDQYTVSIDGDTPIDLIPNENNEVYVDNIALSSGAILTFTKNDSPLSVGVKANIGEHINNCNIDEGDLYVILSIDAQVGKGIYLNVETNEVWVSGNSLWYSLFNYENQEIFYLDYVTSGQDYRIYNTVMIGSIPKNYKFGFFKSGIQKDVVISSAEDNKCESCFYLKSNGIKITETLDLTYIQLKVYDSNTLEVYVSPARELTLAFPSWVNNDSNCIWAWVWGDNFDSYWVQDLADYKEGSTSGTIYVPASSNGMKICRAFVLADPLDYDSLSPKYNVTDDIAITSESVYQIYQ